MKFLSILILCQLDTARGTFRAREREREREREDGRKSKVMPVLSAFDFQILFESLSRNVVKSINSLFFLFLPFFFFAVLARLYSVIATFTKINGFFGK